MYFDMVQFSTVHHAQCNSSSTSRLIIYSCECIYMVYVHEAMGADVCSWLPWVMTLASHGHAIVSAVLNQYEVLQAIYCPNRQRM